MWDLQALPTEFHNMVHNIRGVLLQGLYHKKIGRHKPHPREKHINKDPVVSVALNDFSSGVGPCLTCFMGIWGGMFMGSPTAPSYTTSPYVPP